MESDERPKKVDGSDDIFMVGRGKFGLNPGTSYLMNFEKKVLIETGTSLNVPDILRDLSELDVKKLDYVAVTHIHLDHVGGASFLVERFPPTQVLVHKVGSKHLIDPSHLEESVKKAVGDSFQFYGELNPIPEKKLKPVSGGEELDLGNGKSLKVIHTPGHAPHHVCFYESGSKSLAVGDIAGIYDPGEEELSPSTPPPNFDLEEVIESLKKLQKLDLDRILYTHGGWSDKPQEKIKEYIRVLEDWVSGIRELRLETDDDRTVRKKIREGSADSFFSFKTWKNMDKNELEMNVRGTLLYLDRQMNSG